MIGLTPGQANFARHPEYLLQGIGGGRVALNWRLVLTGCWLLVATRAAMGQGDPFQQASVEFIQRYLREWSAPDALSYMDTIYPDRIDFYGKDISQTELMAIKRKFIARWPQRSFDVHPDSIRAICDAQHLCATEARYDWHYRNPTQHPRRTVPPRCGFCCKTGKPSWSKAARPPTSRQPANPQPPNARQNRFGWCHVRR